MSYWHCDNGHYFKLNQVNDKHLRLRDMKTLCPVCCSEYVSRNSKDQWIKHTGRSQRKQDTEKKTLRNTYE